MPLFYVFFSFFSVVFLRPYAYLACYFYGCCRRVSGYHLYLNACLVTLIDGCRHIVSYRIGDTCNRLVNKIVIAKTSFTAGKGQRSHGLFLIRKQCFLYLKTVVARKIRHLEYNFWCSFYKSIGFIVHGNCCSHVLCIGWKRLLFDNFTFLSQLFVVLSLLFQPHQKRTFGRVSYGLAVVKLGSSVNGKRHIEKPVPAFCIEIQMVLPCRNIGLKHWWHAHTVLSKRSRFIGTDDSGSTHRFRGMKLSN